MVSLQWSEKLTKSCCTHPFLLVMALVYLILGYPDSHRGAPVHLLVILSDMKNQIENLALIYHDFIVCER